MLELGSAQVVHEMLPQPLQMNARGFAQEGPALGGEGGDIAAPVALEDAALNEPLRSSWSTARVTPLGERTTPDARSDILRPRSPARRSHARTSNWLKLNPRALTKSRSSAGTTAE